MIIFGAAGSGDLESVRASVERNARLVRAVDNNARTALLHAARGGHVHVARYLLDHGAAINHHDVRGWTALHWACWGSHAGFVSFLLQSGADVTAVDRFGAAPLIHAAREGGDAVVYAFLEHGGSYVDATEHNGWTACLRACSKGHSGVLRQLLEAGADPILRDGLGRTPSDLAVAYDWPFCVRVLQEWHRAYTLYRARSVRDASVVVAHSSAPVDAAPTYIKDRATSGLTMPTIHIHTHQQSWGQQSDDGGEERHVEVDRVAVGNAVTAYAIEELNGEVFVELMELMGITGRGAQEL